MHALCSYCCHVASSHAAAHSRYLSARYRRCDLHGNDLSAVNGVHQLKGAVIDRARLMQLAEALAAELDVTFGDDLDDPITTV